MPRVIVDLGFLVNASILMKNLLKRIDKKGKLEKLTATLGQETRTKMKLLGQD